MGIRQGSISPPAPRFAPRVLRWKTLARFLSSAPWRVRIPCTGPEKGKASIAGGLTILWWAMRDAACGFAARFRFGPAALACCAGKRFAFPQLRALAGSNPSAMGPKKKGPHSWEPNKSVVGDEGCPRAAGAARAPLRRFAPRVLRWKTLRVSSAPHPVGFESHALGPKKERPPSLEA